MVSISGGRRFGSWFGTALCWAAAAVVAGVCLFIVAYLLHEGWRAIDWRFLGTDPQPSLVEGQAGGVRAPIFGTVLLIAVAGLVTFPLAMGAAIYLSEYMSDSSWLTRSIRVGLEMLAGVPSVVFGMFGLALFSLPLFTFLSSSGAEGASEAFGRSFLIAGIVMGVHILPFMTKVMEEAVRSVPGSLREGSLALGMTKWRTIRKVVLPSARRGIVTAVVLGMGLVAGDTAIVWLTLGGTISSTVDQWWRVSQWVDVLRGTGATLTSYIYFNSPVGEGNSLGAAYGAALLLVLLVLVLNLLAMLFGRRSRGARG